MPRIDYPSLQSLPPETADFIDGKPLINVFRMWLHCPPVVPVAAALGAIQLTQLSLLPRHRELVILLCSLKFAAPYEWDQHVPISDAVGVTHADRMALFDEQTSREHFDDRECSLLHFVREAAVQPQVTEETLTRLRTHYSDREMIECLTLIGYYFTIARLTTVLSIESDAPDGTQLLDAAGTLR